MLLTIMALETSFPFSGTTLHEDDIFNDNIVDQYVVAIDANKVDTDLRQCSEFTQEGLPNCREQPYPKLHQNVLC